MSEVQQPVGRIISIIEHTRSGVEVYVEWDRQFSAFNGKFVAAHAEWDLGPKVGNRVYPSNATGFVRPAPSLPPFLLSVIYEKKGEHVHARVFVNSALAGQLVFRMEEFERFVAALRNGPAPSDTIHVRPE